jgi:bifunctional UDP-N-acetylglucosamine pyrophosphorylase / glucosamine-1-phosphate N-acetyltransferase
MIATQVQAIVLAAGRSSRFNTTKSKLTHQLCGQEIISYSLRLFSRLQIPTTVVVGYQKEAILEIIEKQQFKNITTVEQITQQGTGHALMCTSSQWSAEHILVINGDMPLISSDIIQEVIATHMTKQAAITFVSAHNPNPDIGGYGRVITDNTGIRIVEARDFTGDTQVNCCINAGIYLIKKSFLEEKLQKLQKNQKSQEWYITDLIKAASDASQVVETVEVPFDTVRGINTLKELWIAEHIKNSEIIEYWMNQGVRFMSPQSTHVDIGVIIGKDTTIGTAVQLRGKTIIGTGCFIDSFSILTNALIGNNTRVNPQSVISESQLGEQVQIGPFAHIRNQTNIEREAQIGNFVEVSKSHINNNSKAKHLAYIGNAEIGSRVNIGAGVITCNYNGVSKHTTTIKDGAFIGSNSALCAPVTIQKDVIVAAGSVITQDVPENALAIARAQQINKAEYASQLKEKYAQKAKKVAEQTEDIHVNTAQHKTKSEQYL